MNRRETTNVRKTTNRRPATKRNHRRRGLLLIAFVAICFGLAMYIVANMFAPVGASGTSSSNRQRGSDALSYLQTDYPHTTDTQTPDMALLNTTDITDTGYLALVNRDHAFLQSSGQYYHGEGNATLSASTSSNIMVPAWPTVPVRVVEGMYLHPTALSAVEAMFSSANAANIGTLFVSSGYRGVEHQTVLYDNGANSEYVQPPGHSEHHTGLAVDILAIDVSMQEMSSSPQGRWLANNSYRYGLILRYPDGAQEITGIAYEPWHFRYVGRVHAYFMRQNNLVLEEYISLLQHHGTISFEKGGVDYFISYQTPQNDTIYVPVGLSFIVSNDNTGGYIVKAW